MYIYIYIYMYIYIFMYTCIFSYAGLPRNHGIKRG